MTRTQTEQTCVLAKLFQNLFSAFVFRNVAHKKSNIGNGYIDSQLLARQQFIAI